jgi:hypothetical protein
LVPKDQDALTLPEMLDKVQAEIWTELGANPEGEVSARKPRISSWRRNLQREHLDRLIDLAVPAASSNKAITSLSLMQIKELKKKIDAVLAGGSAMDPYSAAHLTECQLRITKALDAIYIYNQPQAGGGRSGPMIFGNLVPGAAIAPAAVLEVAPAAPATSQQEVPKILEGEPKPQ